MAREETLVTITRTASVTPDGRPDPRQAGRDLGPRRHGAGFWIAGYAFAVTMAFSAVPAPLYVLYQARDHFGALMVTVIFAVYAAGVVASLFLAGHLSDWLGRRRMALIAVAVSMLAGVAFLAWPTVPGLIIGRLVAGVSIGMLTATATAYLSELHAAARPGRPPARAEITATAANLGGIGLGALLGGLLAQYAPVPLLLPYLVGEGLMGAGALFLIAAPETVTRPRPRPRYHPQRVSVPAAHRSLYYAAGFAAAAEFALLGLFTSLAPGFLASTLNDPSHALAGLATFIVFGAAALAQMTLARMALRRQLGLGLGALAAGLVLITAAVWLPSLALLLIGGALAGGGAGVAFKGSVSTVISIAPPRARGEALAGLFLAAYVGLAVPVLGLGVATQLLSAQVSVLGFAAVLLAVVAVVARRLRAGVAGRNPPPDESVEIGRPPVAS
jgi:predicted MFS family arabinose efflux permease